MKPFIFALAFTLIIVLIWELGKWQIRKNTILLSIPELDKKLWTLVSKYVRSKDADWKGFVACYTCGSQYEWKYTDAGHGIPKSITGSLIKFDTRNLRPQCKICNQVRGGMRKTFEANLNQDYGYDVVAEMMKLKDKSLTIQDYQDKIKYYSQWLKSQ